MSDALTILAEHYEDLSLLGQGGMGQVLQGRDTRLDRRVALKTLRPELVGDEECVGRFVLEARCTGQLDHPGIPPVYELGRGQDGNPFYAMKLIRGESMAQVIERLRQGEEAAHLLYTMERRLQMAIQLCDALAFAHDHGWLHRDIKPENVMVCQYGEVYLTDWGLAKAFSRGAPKASSEKGATESPARQPSAGEVLRWGTETYHHMTQMGESKGTPGYLAPEQLLSPEDLDERADVFGMGACLYELFTLQPAFPGDLQAILQAILSGQVAMADSFVTHPQGRVPRELAYVLDRALKREREERYPHVAALRQGLQEALDGQFPAVCLCTGTKRGLGALQDFIDQRRGLAASLIVTWLLLPVLLMLLLWYIYPR